MIAGYAGVIVRGHLDTGDPAPHAFTSGQRRNASLAADNRLIRTGI
jgi:hypothetical protein